MADRRSLLALGLGDGCGGGRFAVAGVEVGVGRYDLYLLVMLVCVVRWVRSGAVVVWLRGLLVCGRQMLELSLLGKLIQRGVKATQTRF
jgi:hypothetical protein